MNREDVLKALNKPSPLGPDIDLTSYNVAKPLPLEEERVRESIRRKIGVEPERLSYLQIGETAIAKAMAEKFKEIGVVVKPMSRALKEDKLAQELSWRIIDPATDKYTAHTYLYGGEEGYFVYVPPGVKVPWPVYTCLSLFRGYNEIQHAHNLIYVDEGAEAVVTTGCLVPHGARGGLHIGITEFYVARKAKLVFTMLHSWGEGTHVRPRTVARVEEEGQFISYYAIYSPVASIQTQPIAYLARGAHARFVTVISGTGNGIYDIGGVAVLEGEGSSAELTSRVLASRGAKVYARGTIEAKSGKTKGHIECLGLLMDNSSSINAIPMLSSTAQEVELTHEAAIGMIAGEKIEYLMSKGFSEDEAKALLIRGFLTADVPGIPENIKIEIDRVVDFIVRHALG